MKKVTAEQFASSAAWKFCEMILRKVISMGISILLARLIAPEAYGVIGLTTIFITFSDIFLLNGFNVALVRKEKAEEIDYSTVLVLSLAAATVLYVLLFFAAPFIAAFYEVPDLAKVLRVITLLLFFQTVGTVISAKATREMEFKKLAIVGVASSTISGLAGVVLAYFGWGIWALVVQQLLANFLNAVFLMIAFRWKLSLKFSKQSAKEMFGFTSGVLSASFLDFAGNNVSGLIVGKAYTPTDLAYMNRGNMFPEIIGLNVYGAINGVMLPTLASRQDNIEEMKRIVRRVLSLTMYVLAPMMFGLVAIGDRLIPLLLTDSWRPSILFMAFGCLSYGLNPIRSTCYSVMYSLGKSGKTVRLECIRVALSFVLIFVNLVILKSDVYMYAGLGMVGTVAIALISQVMMKQEINYSFKELLQDIMPSISISAVMVVIARVVALLPMGDFFVMSLQIVISVIFYVAVSYLIKEPNFFQILGYAKRYLKK